MLINFTVGNYLSFKEKKTLSLEATAIKELNELLINKNGYKLLPSAVIYGANSSGKSNLLEALNVFQYIVTNSSKLNSTDDLPLFSFLLNKETAVKPSYFEIELLINSKIYTYGFIADRKSVYEEWLFFKERKKQKDKCLFVRTKEGIEITEDFPEGKGLEEKARNNGLFLSAVDSLNGVISKEVVREIMTFRNISGIDHESWSKITSDFCTDKNFSGEFQTQIRDFLCSMNVGFNNFEIPEDKEIMKRYKAYTLHHSYDAEGNIDGEVRFLMSANESSGTNKLFDLAAVVIATLWLGYLLVVDELDSKLHPLLTYHIIQLFNDPEKNTRGAQLIFATHDTNLLNARTFRRDQIWFTEKNQMEATDLYSLAEFREPDGTKIRNDRSFEKDYINGRYGAIPYIQN